MREFWTSIASSLSGENGPLYVAVCAITGLTLGWRFLGKNYQAVWESGKICSADLALVDSNTEPKDNSAPSSVADDTTDAPEE